MQSRETTSIKITQLVTDGGTWFLHRNGTENLTAL
jgi:hypothetical protein